MNELNDEIEKKKKEEAAWETETERTRKLQFQQVAERLGFESYEEVLPTLCDRAIAPTEQLAQKMLACLRCPVCCRVAHEPVETSCCGHVLCRCCCKRVKELGKSCPVCRNDYFEGCESRLAARLIGVCDVTCPFCEVSLPQSCLKDHFNQTCPEFPIMCLICLQHSIPRKFSDLHHSLKHPAYFEEYKVNESKIIKSASLLNELVTKHRDPRPPKWRFSIHPSMPTWNYNSTYLSPILSSTPYIIP